MNRHLLSLGVLATAAACSTMSDDTRSSTTVLAPAAGSAATARVFPYEVHRATLDNGLRVVMVPMESDGLVSYWSIVRTGSRDEVEPGVTGFAHFFEHMMFRGTEKRPGKVYDRIVNSMGADANAFTTDDFTAYHLSFGKQDLATVVEIEADRFQNLKYDEQQFRTEAGAVFGEYRKGRSSPFEVLFEAIQDTAFDVHTYKHTTIGFVKDIEAMPEQFGYSRTFFDRFYRPENVIVLVTGDIDPKSTLALVQTQYGGWKKGYQAPKVPVEPPQTKERRIDVPFDGQTQPILTLNFKGAAFAPQDKAFVAARLVAPLAFGETSPLYKKLVLDEQKVDSLGASFDQNRDPGLWSVYAIVKEPADVPYVESEIWRTVEALKKDLVDAARLTAVRSNLRYSFLGNLGTPDETAQSLARFIALTGDVAAIDTMFTTLATVGAEDVREAARKFLRRESCTVARLATKGVELPSMSALDVRPSTEPALLSDAGATSVFDRVLADRAHFAFADPSVPTMPRVANAAEVSQAPVLMPVAADPMVSFQIWFQAGSQDDPVGKEGLAQLTASLVSEGATKTDAYDAILQKLFPMAAGYGTSVDKEMTIVRGQVHKDHVTGYVELLTRAICEPAFKQEDFERLRDQMISTIENDLRFASGEELAKAVLTERVFAGTRYAHPGVGTVQSLRALTVDDVKAFHASRWTRDNVVIGLGGGFAQDLPGTLKKKLGALPAGKPAAAPAPVPQKVEGRDVVIVDNPDAIGSSISCGIPITAKRGTKEFAALWIANSWLGEHRNSSSHLYQVIREERGINYGNYSYIEAFPNGGRRSQPPTGVGRRAQMFELWIRTVPPEKTLFSLRAALREVENLVANGLTKEQFEQTRKFLQGYTLHFAETTMDRLGYAVDDRFHGIDGHLASFRRMLGEVTHEDVDAAIKKHMRIDDLVIAIVTNDAKAIAEALASGAPSPIQYGAGITKSAETIAEDALIQKHPLRITSADITTIGVRTVFEGGPVGS